GDLGDLSGMWRSGNTAAASCWSGGLRPDRAALNADGALAWAEYLTEPDRIRERTAKLREARLAREAAIVSKPKDRKFESSRRSPLFAPRLPSLFRWLFLGF